MAPQAKALATQPDPLSASPSEVHACILKGCSSESFFHQGSLESSLLHLRGSPQLQPSLISSPDAYSGWGVGPSSHPRTHHSSSIKQPPPEVPSQPSAAITILGMRFRSRITSLVCLRDRRNNNTYSQSPANSFDHTLVCAPLGSSQNLCL